MSIINDIEIKNFKSIRHQKIEGCKRINVFVGEPNVGKSNILEAIGLLTFLRQKRPTGLKGLVRFEKLTQIFNNSNIQNPAIIKFNDNYVLSVIYEDEIGVGMNLDNLEGKNFRSNLYVPALKVGSGQIHSSSTDGVDNFSGKFTELKNVNVKPYSFSDSKIFNQSISALELSIPLGVNMFEVIINNKAIQMQFVDLLKPYNLNLLIDDSANEIKILSSIKDGVIHSLPISLIADTLVRLVFFKTAILSNKNSVLLFEEPESHMYPPYISKFTSDMIYDENGNQFFIATHSPYVINDIMENLKKDDYAIYTVGYDKENGETLIRRMTDEELHEIYQYGVDLFLNLENFLPHAQQQ
jgi:AAA15 family ATPase/GTPase